MAARDDLQPASPSGRVPLPIFPNYKEMPARVPQAVWYACRAASVALALGTALLCFVRPAAGLFIFWRLLAPALPIVFFLAPGIWRNVCPMAALNQTPRRYRFTRGLTLPAWLREYGYLVAGGLFVLIVAARTPLLNGNGPALGALLLAALAFAFVSGTIFKGKSGWCSSICPLLPLQRLYGQTPFAVIPNSYCSPCVSCAAQCYDFNPHTAHLSDLLDDDEHHRNARQLFAAVLPGMIVAYFTLPAPPATGVWLFFARFGLSLLASAGSYFALSTLVRAPRPLITALYGAAALNLFYWYALPQDVRAVAGSPLPAWLQAALQVPLLALTAIWLFRTREKLGVLTGAVAPAAPLPSGPAPAPNQQPSAQAGRPFVTFLPEEKQVPALPNASLLEVIEAADLRIEAGCRMGMCGADPVAILGGEEYLSPITADERTTLERLGLARNTRMACCARVQGPVTVSLTPERARQPQLSMIMGFRYDPQVQRVVIVGNGIAGVTTADHVRRRHPRCEIHLIGREKYHLYTCLPSAPGTGRCWRRSLSPRLQRPPLAGWSAVCLLNKQIAYLSGHGG